ncbi:hypothetical protein GCM10027063_22720 [Promicromonospora xylanilytica]
MGTSDPRIRSVRLARLDTRYPRTVGRNARLGSHGSGPDSDVAVLVTEDGRTGWGLFEGPPGDVGRVEGRLLSELIGAGTGVLDDADRWLDIALHDLLGVVLDAPVHALLGGRGSVDVPVYDGAIYFDDLDPQDTPRGIEVLLEECRADAARGYRDFKLKIGRGNRWLPRAQGDVRDIEVTRAVRDAFPDARILVDANDGYDLDGFVTYLEAVADVGLFWVEEPFLDDADDLAALRAWLDAKSPETRIAEGETSPDVGALLPLAAAGSIDVLLMDVLSYGLTAWRRLMPDLAAAGVHGSPHAWGRPLKTRYAAHLAAGLGNVEIVEGVPGDVAGVDRRLLRPVDGVLRLDGSPGFGVPLPDEAHLRQLVR